ncbi:Integral membrane protein [Fulvivirga imtechensis AK7]|uniref:Integral membrane protein n=1 Tax=Fulvivirga imtechensis AK7 TaxID=1237149 RepID=L8JLI1_9BACT|nr:hypothetical protein [Fulvivirga imtechensis]ELR69108.1 Integral membrane protein [Fulvivirga imtechensis AK7]
MLDVLLCVLANVGIFVCFRLFSTFKMDTFQAIVFNYITCVATGLIFMDDHSILKEINTDTPWAWIGMGLGAVFIGTFYLMAITTQKFSMTVSSIAAKMSLIIPVLFSLFILEIQSKIYTWVNFGGMGLALISIFMSSYKERKIETHQISGFDLVLPLLVFVFGGVIDTTINYTNYRFLTAREAPVFPFLVFTSAGIIGIVVLTIRRRGLALKNILGGITLGVVNYFSIYFLITALSAFSNDGAIVYPLVNVGIIVFAALISVFFFKERLSKVNRIGIILAILAIVFISYQEIVSLL